LWWNLAPASGDKGPDNIVDRSFGNFFPSAFINNKIDKNNSWVVSYSRRVNRPSFFQLAPFVIFIDPNSFWSGNISLLPSLTDAVKAEYRHKSILLSLQYSRDKNAISLFQPRINEDNKQVSTAENLVTETFIDFETNVVRLTYSKSFGNKKLKGKGRIKTGSEEEQRRFQ